MKNFLFVYPRVATPGQYYNFPIGMAYVVSYMKHAGHFNIACLNLCHHTSSIHELMADVINKKNIDVVCTGSVSAYWREVEDILVAAKEINPDIVTVAGGAIVTSDPEFVMQHLPIDFGVLGEGEQTMAELADALNTGSPFEDISGIIYAGADGKPIMTEPRKPLENLDELPFPDYEAFELDKWLNISWVRQPSLFGLLFDYDEQKNMVEILTSRSCPYDCTFCYHPLGRKYRQRSLDNVFQEIDYLVERYNTNILSVLDELFSLNIDRVTEFIARIKKYNLKWMAQWRIDNVNPEIFKKLKTSGILTLGLGIESMSDTILTSMKKKTTRKDIEYAMKIALDAGVRTGSNLIFGDPAETLTTINESLNWCLNHPEYDINLDFILAIPDSHVFRYAIEKKLIKDKLQFIRSGFPVINLTQIPDKDFFRFKRKIRYWNIVLKHRTPGIFISSKKTGVQYKDKPIFMFTVKCPQCGKVSTYRHYRFYNMQYMPIMCKNCYKILKIKTAAAFPGWRHRIISFFAQNTVIVYQLYLCDIKKYLCEFSLFNRIFKFVKRLIGVGVGN